jgi:hypothetical protein
MLVFVSWLLKLRGLSLTLVERAAGSPVSVHSHVH